jgi:hypothetical protein
MRVTARAYSAADASWGVAAAGPGTAAADSATMAVPTTIRTARIGLIV